MDQREKKRHIDIYKWHIGLSGWTVPGWVEDYSIIYYIEGTEEILRIGERKTFDSAIKAAKKNVVFEQSLLYQEREGQAHDTVYWQHSRSDRVVFWIFIYFTFRDFLSFGAGIKDGVWKIQ